MRAVALVVAGLLCSTLPSSGDDRVAQLITPTATKCLQILPLQAIQVGDKLHATPDQRELLLHYGEVKGWMMGYFSGVNVWDGASKGNILNGMGGRDMMNWLFSYCQANPTSHIALGAAALHQALKKK